MNTASTVLALQPHSMRLTSIEAGNVPASMRAASSARRRAVHALAFVISIDARCIVFDFPSRFTLAAALNP